ncbi:MAG: hypothetical protein ACLGI6_20565 [Gammaproteobacteria bacterium]
MKRLLPLLGLFCFGTAAARTAFQVRCEETIDRTVSTLITRQNGYTIDNSRSFRVLTAMKAPGTPNSYVLGLTRTESRVSVNLDGRILQDRASGYECVAPQIRVSLFYAPIVVYIGSEFAPGTCAYREILAHEMRHLKAYMDHLPRVESVVRSALARRFEGKPLYAPIGHAQALLEKEIDTGWMPYMKNQMGAVEQQQAAIDSPREYARLSKVCKGEVQSLIGPARRRTR